MTKPRVIAAMSGGVDSSVAAALLVGRGFDVVGLFMRTGVKAGDAAAAGRQGCCGVDDALDARRVADRLGIPFYAVNLEREFEALIEWFIDEYEAARTPNPCVRCNRDLKFGRLLRFADELGAEAVATGHYARVAERGGRRAVARAADLEKDQSYVLFPLAQEQLRRAIFPLADLSKLEVRAIAKDLGLHVSDKAESQEICFVPSGRYSDLIEERRQGSLHPGPIVDAGGREIGEHRGHQLYTIGQRRGLPGGFTSPLYVLEVRAGDNTIVAGGAEALGRRTMDVERIVFGAMGPAAPGSVFRGTVKVRYRHAGSPGAVTLLDATTLRVTFDMPERAITPGQAAVVYDDQGVVLCGGWIR